MINTLEHEAVINTSPYVINNKDSVIQLVQSKSGGSRYRVFDNKTGKLHSQRFVRLFEAKRFVRAGYIILS